MLIATPWTRLCHVLRGNTVCVLCEVLRKTRTITGSAEETQAAATITIDTSTLTITETVRAQANDDPYSVYSEPWSLLDTSSISLPIPPTAADPYPVYSEPWSLLDTSSISLPIPPTAAVPPATAPSLLPAPPTFTNSYSILLPTLGPSSSSSSLIASSSTTSSFRPVGTSINPLGCPTINNTIYTAQNGEQFQLQCYRQYGGPVSIGLDQFVFRECIEQCSKVNQGFSAVRCFGVTWLQYNTGVRCNLKAQ
ncbi:MAG: hypothetical protein Q9224_004882, partial [Gallowayella concinna]